MTGRLFAAIACLLAAAGPARARTFSEILGTPITQRIGQALAGSVGRALPVTSASAGIVYHLDFATGAFERETSILGQLFLERAEPVGKGRFNASLSYQRVEIDTIEGEDIRELEDTEFPIVDGGSAVIFPRFALDLKADIVTAAVTYGLTDDLEVNLTIPVVYSEFGLHLVQQSVDPASNVVIRGSTMQADESSSKLGVGDLFLRGKYRFLKGALFQAAAGLVIRVPTGEEENFQGTGDLELAPLLYVSTRSWQPTSALRLQPYLNGGVNFDADDVDQSEARWGIGMDLGMWGRGTAAVAVLGRHAFQRLAPAGFFSFPRTDGTSRPLFGIEGERPDVYDFSVGGRVNVWRDTLIVFANVLLPLNDDGVRSDVIPLVGVEATF